ncbi:hypothetical protein UA08_06413 [Talaromyces atroroseus]|uniref:Phosphatidylglycerol/phosphatidylinositol transfer protein n=1 Tax=Talaromyces atroroseus TaxID=1441469 RepID=A0A225ACQ4_TALAT|nr:hypothetical protein UA08_06413 [Talaromyces atroroseus]OKL58170.1 hypothetical protein UA08_06413 [Talaromyces atroroseus]
MFGSRLFVAFVARTALAQSVQIGLPDAGTVLNPGEDYTVQIQCPDSLTSSQEVALVIGIQQCQNGHCFPPDETLGNLLYSGSFNPQFHEPSLPPYQNFTVHIPDTMSSESALVGVAHFALVGDSFAPLIDYHNQSVSIA